MQKVEDITDMCYFSEGGANLWANFYAERNRNCAVWTVLLTLHCGRCTVLIEEYSFITLLALVTHLAARWRHLH